MNETFEIFFDVHEKNQVLMIPLLADSASAKTISFSKWYAIPYKVRNTIHKHTIL